MGMGSCQKQKSRLRVTRKTSVRMRDRHARPLKYRGKKLNQKSYSHRNEHRAEMRDSEGRLWGSHTLSFCWKHWEHSWVSSLKNMELKKGKSQRKIFSEMKKAL
jgi:hypothetical protein